MAAVAERNRYVALVALPVELDGERYQIEAGEEIPDALVGDWLHWSIEAGKVQAIPSLASLTDDELAEELTARGYEVKKFEPAPAPPPESTKPAAKSTATKPSAA